MLLILSCIAIKISLSYCKVMPEMALPMYMLFSRKYSCSIKTYSVIASTSFAYSCILTAYISNTSDTLEWALSTAIIIMGIEQLLRFNICASRKLLRGSKLVQ